MFIRPLIHMKESEIGAVLDRLGFTEGSYSETILVTVNTIGSFNAAPMGVIRVCDSLVVKPYKSSATYVNLQKSPQASINITDDPMIFLLAAFKGELEDAPRVDEWRVDGSDAVVIAEKRGEEELSDIRASFTLEPVSVRLYNEAPTVFSRGRAEAIEAVIHATRVKVFQSEGKLSEVMELLGKLEACFDVINRVSSKESTEREVSETIKELLERWGIKH